MTRETPLPSGTLPDDAQRRLKAANQIGRSGSIQRTRAIDQAYRYIEDTYPEFLRRNNT